MKILCLCRGGRVRSVAVRYVLTDDYHVDALAAGLCKNSPATLDLLCEWADAIVVCSANLLATAVPAHWPRRKLLLFDLGPDRWGYAEHPDLIAECRRRLPDVLNGFA